MENASIAFQKDQIYEKNLAIGYQLKGGFSEYMFLSKELIENGPIKKYQKTLILK